MIQSMAHLKGLVKRGKAGYSNGTALESIIEHDGARYVAVDRYDKQRVDHYEIA